MYIMYHYNTLDTNNVSSFDSLTVISPLIITSVTDFVTIETLFQGQKVGFSNPTVLQSDSNFHFTNRVGLSRLNCTKFYLPTVFQS